MCQSARSELRRQPVLDSCAVAATTFNPASYFIDERPCVIVQLVAHLQSFAGSRLVRREIAVVVLCLQLRRSDDAAEESECKGISRREGLEHREFVEDFVE